MGSLSERMNRLADEARHESALVRETLGIDSSANEVLRLLTTVSELRSASLLCDAIGLSKSQTTNAIRLLEDRGWIDAQADRNDRRKLVLRINSRGQDAYHYFRGKAAAAGISESVRWTSFVRALAAKYGLTGTEARVLAFATEHAPVTAGSVSRGLDLPQSTASVALASLARQGLTAFEDAPDKRSRNWRLTAAGRDVLGEIARLIEVSDSLGV